MSKLKVYIASPFFNDFEVLCLERAEKILFGRGFNVFSPRLNEVREEITSKDAAWSLETFVNDRKFIDWADVVVALYHGCYSDSGTAWECGYAYGTGTPIVAVHVGKDSKNGSNLMVHESAHANISLDELENYDFEMMPSKRYSGIMF